MEESPPDWQAEDVASEAAPVLVAIMNNQRDLQIARQKGWYRIPVKCAPRRVGAEYLAFYQTKAFGQEAYAVNYYAPIRRIHLAQRLELLPEEVNHPRAGDWYYRVQIGPLQRLPHPVPSQRLRRITFIPTTLARLLSAREINDLWLGSDDEERLWEAFRENDIRVERRVSLQEGDEAYVIDFAAYCRRGKVAILCGGAGPLGEGSALRERPSADYELAAAGWKVLRFSLQQIEDSLEDCVVLAKQAIAQEGGLREGLDRPAATEQDLPPTESR